MNPIYCCRKKLGTVRNLLINKAMEIKKKLRRASQRTTINIFYTSDGQIEIER